MRIALDVDDTITDSYNLIFDLIGEFYKVDSDILKKNGTTYYDIMDDKLNFPNYEGFVRDNFENLLSKVQLKCNAKEVINKLYDEGHQIFFITARSSKEYSNPYMTTYNYLVNNEILFDRIFVNAENKGIICKEELIDIFIDDSVKNCTDTIKNGINTYIFDNSFNKKDTNFKRVYNWNEVYELINSLKKKE